MKSTSALARRRLENSGKLPERYRQVIAVLKHDGPSTGNEISDRAGVPGLHKRLSELKRAGLIREVGKRTCRITREYVTIWALVTSDQTDLFEGVAA